MVEEHFSFRQEGEKDDMRGYPDRKDENERNIAHRPPPSEPFHVKNSEVEFFEIQRNKKKNQDEENVRCSTNLVKEAN